MTRSIEKVNQAVGRIRSMPYGIARTEAAEQEARRTEEEGPQECLAYALFALVESYVWGGEGAKAYVPFRRAMRLWDTSPELFDEGDRHDFFWSFKWMVTGLVEYPEIPAAQISATVADMERRFAVAGNGMDAVAYAAFRWADHTGDPDVDLAFSAWATTPRDEYSQCEACELGDQAVHHAAAGRLEEAVRIIEGVPETTRWCATEPADMLSVLALAHLELGHGQQAVTAHRQAVAALAQTESDMVAARGRRLELLARGGQHDLALEALREDGALVLRADSPLGRLRFQISVLRALTAAPELAQRPVAIPGVPATTGAELLAWARTEASALAAAFDARNGTDRLGREVAGALATQPTAVTLDLSVIDPSAIEPSADGAGPSGAGATAATALGDPGATGAGAPWAWSPVGADPAATPDRGTALGGGPVPQADVTALLAEADTYVAAQDHLSAVGRYREAAASLDAAGRLEDAGIAWAEAARCADLLHDTAGAHAAYRAGAARLGAGGAAPALIAQVLTAWAPVAARAEASPEVLTIAAGVREQLELGVAAERPDVAAALLERERGELRRALADLDDASARLIATSPEAGVSGRDRSDAVALAVRAAESYAAVGAVADAAHAFWLAGRVQRELGALEDAVWSLESATEGFEIAHQRPSRTEVGGELVALLRATGQDARADELLAQLTS